MPQLLHMHISTVIVQKDNCPLRQKFIFKVKAKEIVSILNINFCLKNCAYIEQPERYRNIQIIREYSRHIHESMIRKNGINHSFLSSWNLSSRSIIIIYLWQEIIIHLNQSRTSPERTSLRANLAEIRLKCLLHQYISLLWE